MSNLKILCLPPIANTLRDLAMRFTWVVWGTIATGNGQSHLNELLGTTDSPGMNQRTFNKIENDINGWWNEVLQNDLRQAVEEEKELAIANGCFHEGSSLTG